MSTDPFIRLLDKQTICPDTLNGQVRWWSLQWRSWLELPQTSVAKSRAARCLSRAIRLNRIRHDQTPN